MLFGFWFNHFADYLPHFIVIISRFDPLIGDSQIFLSDSIVYLVSQDLIWLNLREICVFPLNFLCSYFRKFKSFYFILSRASALADKLQLKIN